MAVVEVMVGLEWGSAFARVDVVLAHDIPTMMSDGVSMTNDSAPMMRGGFAMAIEVPL